MAQLGSVLGAILADLMRARLVADELSRELADEYQSDPTMASMSVPRVVVEEAALTLRFAVTDLEQVAAAEPDEKKVRAAWIHHAAPKVVPKTLARLGVPAEGRSEAVDAIEKAAGETVGEPTALDVRKAIRGDAGPLVAKTAEPAVESWRKLPADVRAELGGKAAFRRELEQSIRDDFGTFVERQRELELVRASLASRIEVGIRPEELAEQPELVQEFRITARGADMDVLLNELEGGER